MAWLLSGTSALTLDHRDCFDVVEEYTDAGTAWP
jgi:hypothetical protein